ncbi:MAG: hypothetical protein ACOC2W_04325, partial [bacterium]
MPIGQINNNESGLNVRNKLNQLISQVNNRVDGREIVLRATDTQLEWKYDDELVWNNWFSLSGLSMMATGSIFVDFNEGDDDNGDGTPNNPYKTFQKAIDESSAGETVISLGSEVITQNIVCKDDVNIYAPNTELLLGGLDENQLLLARGRTEFKQISRTTGSNNMIEAVDTSASSGYSLLILKEINDSGAGTTILNGLNRPLDLHINQVFVNNSGIFLQDVVDSVSHTHVNFDDLYLSSSNCTGVKLENGGNIVGFIQHIKELSSGIGTSTAFDILDGEINITAHDCRV